MPDAFALDRLTIETFTPLLGQTFRLDGGEGDGIELRLESAEVGGGEPYEGRVPFSLEFGVPPEVSFAQGMYRMTHPDVGTLELFLVPLAPDGRLLEAVFA